MGTAQMRQEIEVLKMFLRQARLFADRCANDGDRAAQLLVWNIDAWAGDVPVEISPELLARIDAFCDEAKQERDNRKLRIAQNNCGAPDPASD